MQNTLEDAGLSQNEALVYVTLSKAGLASGYQIAQKAHLHRANTYQALARLMGKSLVAERHIGDKILYEARDPHFLMQLLEDKRKKLELIIPQLRLQQRAVMKETTFQEYKGADAFVNILLHFLDFDEPILVWGVPQTAYSFLKHRIDIFHKERLRRKITMKHIYNTTAYERIRTLRKMPYTPIRILPALYDSDVATNVCGDEVIFIVFKAPLHVMLIKNKDMADAYKRYFALLWKNARKV